MGKGKHSGDPNDFGDTSSYTYRGYTEDEEEVKKVNLENENDDEEKDDIESLSRRRADEFLNGFGQQEQNDYMDFDDEKKFNFFKLFLVLLVIALVVVAGIMGYRYFNAKDTEEPEPEPVEPVKNKMIEQIEGYDVLGKIVIEDQNIEQYILDSTEDNALENGVIKLYGTSLNSYGNFCIAGHNKEEVFANLANLEVGDEFKVVDPDLEETVYEVTEISKAEPEDLKCLMQDESKIEITLITCEDASTSRLIIKAEEKTEEDNEQDTNTTNTTNTVLDAEENE